MNRPMSGQNDKFIISFKKFVDQLQAEIYTGISQDFVENFFRFTTSVVNH